ncbi:precorrin-3B synthase [Cryptosporangium sp. NPDC048952]|uniref:precorrin-3B synthase n=1 Tax=Cryptosporangium sp. NPDC048952 TaxID=3363961 RepID=UPI00372332B7
MPTAVPFRQAADSCPGALQVHEAADGGLARVRIPGGVVSLTQWNVLRSFAPLELTSRGNLQIRGVTDSSALADRLADVGLLPSATHERVRNIVASPLGGVFGVVDALDRALCGSLELAELPGRFLFAIDTDRDVISLGADVTVLLGSDTVPVLLAGVDSGLRVRPDQAVPALIAAARCFLAERAAQASKAWRLSELDDAVPRVASRMHESLACARIEPSAPESPSPPASTPLGVVAVAPHPAGAGAPHADGAGAPHADGAGAPHADGAGAPHADDAGAPHAGARDVGVAVGVPLGRLSGAQMDVIAAVAREEIIVTPWRGVVLPRADPMALATLADAGLITDPASPWASASACTGLPGCAKSRADVRADAAVALGLGLGLAQRAPTGQRPVSTRPAAAHPDTAHPGTAHGRTVLPVHFVGCERRCGHPAGVHVDVLATADGYQVDGEQVTVDELPAAVAAARRTNR